MNNDNMTHETTHRDWLAALLLRQPDRFMPRFTAALMRWQTLSRGFRRRFTRRVAATAAGAALVLAMAGSPLLVPAVRAASIDVDNGVVVVADDGDCSLREAILNANSDSQVFGSAGECAPGSGDDIINLPVDGDFLLTDGPYYSIYGDPLGLPLVESTVSIEGNGSTVRRDPNDTDYFGIIAVDSGDLSINNLTISGGAGYIGGGVYANFSELSINNSTISGNLACGVGGGVGAAYSQVTVTNSTIADNYACFIGGGIFTYTAPLTLVNSTISGNSAGYAVGGVNIGAYETTVAITSVTPDRFGGDGMPRMAQRRAEREATLGPQSVIRHTIVNSTITDNYSYYLVGGVGAYGPQIVTFERSIISGNRASVEEGVEVYTTDEITAYADRNNVFGRSSLTDTEAFSGFAPGASDVNATSDGANIPLGQILDTTLADNGGTTLTHNLVLGSPALDFAPDADCVAPSLTDGVDQRGAARPFDVVGQGNEVTDTCDAGAVEAEAPIPFAPAAVFMSTRTAGTTGDGLDFGSEDIIAWDGAAWSMWFDGSDAGLATTGKARHNINAFWIPDASADEAVMSFAQNRRTVPGVGPKVDGMDLVWWDGSSFSFWFDGSDVGLTNKTQEKIDGLHVLPGSESPIGAGCVSYLLVSTQGPGKVPNHSGGQLKFQGEDVLGFCATSLGETTAGLWTIVLDGSAEGMPRNSTDSISVSDDGGTLFLTTQGAFNVDAAAGGHSMVYEFDFGTGTFSGPVFSAPAEGLPEKVDGLQMN